MADGVKASYTPEEVNDIIDKTNAHYDERIKNQKEAIDRLMKERTNWIKQVAGLKEENRDLRAQLQGGS